MYVDIDPVAVTHTRQILDGNERATVIQADLRHPGVILKHPELHRMRRQAQNFDELPVRADQLQIGVEHGDALAHMVERRLQDLPVEVERGVGIIQ